MPINSISSESLINKYNSVQNNVNDTNGGFAAQLEKAAENSADDKDKAKLKGACRDMEAVFLNLMLSKMRDTVPKANLMGDETSKDDIMRSMLDGEMTKNMAKAGGMGLADMLYRQLSIQNAAISPSKKGQTTS